MIAGVKAALAALLFSSCCLHAQDAAAPSHFSLTMAYDRPGLSVPHWQVVVPQRGMGQYTGAPTTGLDPGTVLFEISAAGRARLAAMLERSHGLAPCETKAKGLANMGMKTLEYTDAGGTTVKCSFNYSDNKALTEAATYVMSMVDTLQTGLELERLHRYDRLGLDPVMLRLVDDVKTGHAVELVAIRPALTSLVTDTAVLDRVRAKAQQLLDLAKQEEAEAAP